MRLVAIYTLNTHLHVIGCTPVGHGTNSHVSFLIKVVISSSIAICHFFTLWASANELDSSTSWDSIMLQINSTKSPSTYLGLVFLMRDDLIRCRPSSSSQSSSWEGRVSSTLHPCLTLIHQAWPLKNLIQFEIDQYSPTLTFPHWDDFVPHLEALRNLAMQLFHLTTMMTSHKKLHQERHRSSQLMDHNISCLFFCCHNPQRCISLLFYWV